MRLCLSNCVAFYKLSVSFRLHCCFTTCKTSSRRGFCWNSFESWSWKDSQGRRYFSSLPVVGKSSEEGVDGRMSSGGVLPVVVVLGSTASGKSKLAIDLAKHVGGEVISADSMQIYEGLDILTNKATEEEMQSVPHHMISILDRSEKFDVVKFRDTALPLVQDILSRGKVPFIVGGTNYYIESLLWKVLIGENRNSDSDCEQEEDTQWQRKKPRMDDVDAVNKNPVLKFMKERRGDFTEKEVTQLWSISDIHQALKEVDPDRAIKFHPNDIRKVVRSLQVFFRTGIRHSTLIEEQWSTSSNDEHESSGNISQSSSQTIKLGGPLRFPNSVCFWIQAERDVLNDRIARRVDKMVQGGMRAELDSYIDKMAKENRKWDFQEGQLQSIGVKEFESYIQLPAHERDSDLGQKLFRDGLERLKTVTKQYAKRQVQWIKQRFLKPSRRQLPPVYGLNGNEPADGPWSENVTAPAIQILDAYMHKQLDLPILNEKRLKVLEDTNEDLITRTCEVCNKTLFGSSQWESHMKSSKHWKMVKRKKKQLEEASLIDTEQKLVQEVSAN